MGWNAIGVQWEEVASRSSHMLIDVGVMVDTEGGGTGQAATSLKEHMKELLYHSATDDGSTNAIPLYISHANNPHLDFLWE